MLLCSKNKYVENSATNCTCSRIRQLLERYSTRRRAIPIDFRRELRRFPKIKRGRHYLHPYPAKLLAEIPFFFLANSIFSKPGDSVFDPFCGTGTVLLEAVRSGRIAIGADANPLARLITQTKLANVRTASVLSAVSRIRSAVPLIIPHDYPRVINIDYWFHHETDAQRL
jgi:DNA modification methylase